jgi:hypothetical protein
MDEENQTDQRTKEVHQLEDILPKNTRWGVACYAKDQREFG